MSRKKLSKLLLASFLSLIVLAPTPAGAKTFNVASKKFFAIHPILRVLVSEGIVTQERIDDTADERADYFCTQKKSNSGERLYSGAAKWKAVASEQSYSFKKAPLDAIDVPLGRGKFKHVRPYIFTTIDCEPVEKKKDQWDNEDDISNLHYLQDELDEFGKSNLVSGLDEEECDRDGAAQTPTNPPLNNSSVKDYSETDIPSNDIYAVRTHVQDLLRTYAKDEILVVFDVDGTLTSSYHPRTGVVPRPNAKEVVREFKNAGIPMIASSAHGYFDQSPPTDMSTISKLNNLGLYDSFKIDRHVPTTSGNKTIRDQISGQDVNFQYQKRGNAISVAEIPFNGLYLQKAISPVIGLDTAALNRIKRVIFVDDDASFIRTFKSDAKRFKPFAENTHIDYFHLSPPVGGFQQPGFGFQQPGFQNGFQQPNFQVPGFQQGLQRQGFQNPGFQNPGFQNPAFPQQGVPFPGVQPGGLPNSIFQQPAHAGIFNNAGGFNQNGLNHPGNIHGLPYGFQDPLVPNQPNVAANNAPVQRNIDVAASAKKLPTKRTSSFPDTIPSKKNMKGGAGALLYTTAKDTSGQTSTYVLLGKERWGDAPGTWCMMNGSVDPGESFLKTAARETYEESANVYRISEDSLKTYPFTLVSNRNGSHHLVTYFVPVPFQSGRNLVNSLKTPGLAAHSDEMSDYMWVKLSDLQKALKRGPTTIQTTSNSGEKLQSPTAVFTATSPGGTAKEITLRPVAYKILQQALKDGSLANLNP